MSSLLDFPEKQSYDAALLDWNRPLPFPEPPARSKIGETEQKFLIGREKEVEKLRSLLDQVRKSGEPKLTLLQGRQGVGKSSLVSWFVMNANTSKKPVLLVPLETDSSGAIFCFKNFYTHLLRTLRNKRGLYWIGRGSLVKTLEAMEHALNTERFQTILKKLFTDTTDYIALKRNSDELDRVIDRNPHFLSYFWSFFQQHFHTISPLLPTMEFELMAVIWFSTINNPETFNAVRALEGRGEFQGFEIRTDPDARHHFKELLQIVRWIRPDSVFILVIDHLEAGVSSPATVYTSLFSLLLQLRQINHLLIVLSGTYDAYNAVETIVEQDMSRQIETWALNNLIPLNPLPWENMLQVVETHLWNYWNDNRLPMPAHVRYYPFGEDALSYLYEITDKDLRKTLEILYNKVYDFRTNKKIDPIISVYDAFKKFRERSSLSITDREAVILKKKLLDPRIQDHQRSKKVEKGLIELLKTIARNNQAISNVQHEPRLNGIRPDIILEIGNKLGTLKKTAIEVKIYRVGTVIPATEVTKTHSLLQKKLVDYVVWFTNKPLHEKKYSLPSSLMNRVGRVTELTDKELGYLGLVMNLPELFPRGLSFEDANFLLTSSGLNLDQIINDVLSLPPLKTIEAPQELVSDPQKAVPSLEVFPSEKPSSSSGQETIKETPPVSSELENLERLLEIVLRENKNKKFVQAKTILKQLKAKNLNLKQYYNHDDAINTILNLASKKGYKTTPTRIYFS